LRGLSLVSSSSSLYRALRGWLGLARTRLFVAVLVPACIGASVAFARGAFSWGFFLLIALGLVLAESMNLFLADWTLHKGIDLSGGRAAPPPVLAGSPMLAERTLPLDRTVFAALACAVPAGLVFLFFAWQRGLPVIGLAVFAVVAGLFYVAPPFRYAYFSTATLPPAIAWGVYYVLAGTASWEPLLAGLPIGLLSAGTIYIYRVLYDERHDEYETRRWHVLLLFALCHVALIAFALLGWISPWALLGLLTLPLLWPIARVLRSERADSLPATALGVLMHSSTALLIALGYVLGAA
jgi:1,4-dihydroxy-2-naphthoate polyprenyltransferase